MLEAVAVPEASAQLQATPDGPAGYNGFPNTAVLTPADNTAYIVNVGGGAASRWSAWPGATPWTARAAG